MTNLTATAIRLLSRGRPITITELAGAAGVDAADLMGLDQRVLDGDLGS